MQTTYTYPVLGPRLTRLYAQKDVASPRQTSNVTNPQVSSAESQGINQRAAVGRTDKNDADNVSIQDPVSHPEDVGTWWSGGGDGEPGTYEA
jgi:hypothetical protein